MMNTSTKLDNMVVRQSEMMNDVKMILAMSHRREHVLYQMLHLNVTIFEGFFEQANRFLANNGGVPFDTKLIDSIKGLMQSWILKPAWAEQETAEEYMKKAENEKQRAEEEYADIAKATVEDLGKTFPPPSVFEVEKQGTAFHLDAGWVPKTILEHALDMDPCDKYLALGEGWRNLVTYPKGNPDYPGLAMPSATNDAVLEEICNKYNEEAADDDLDDGTGDAAADDGGEPVLVIPVPKEKATASGSAGTRPSGSKRPSKDTSKKAKKSNVKAKQQEVVDDAKKIKPTGKQKTHVVSSDDDFEEPVVKKQVVKKPEEAVEVVEAKAEKKKATRRSVKKKKKKSSGEQRDGGEVKKDVKKTDKKLDKKSNNSVKSSDKKTEKKTEKKPAPRQESTAFSEAMDNPSQGKSSKSSKRSRPSSSSSDQGPVVKQRKITLDNEQVIIRKEDEKLISADKVNVKVTVKNVPPEKQDLGDKFARSNLRNILNNKRLDKALFAQEERNVPDASSRDTSTSTLIIDSNPTTPARRSDQEEEVDMSTSCDGEDASPHGGNDEAVDHDGQDPDENEIYQDDQEGDQQDDQEEDQEEADQNKSETSGQRSDDDGSLGDDEDEAIKKKKVESSSLLQDLLGKGSGIMKIFGRDQNNDPYDKALIADREKLDESDRNTVVDEETQNAPTVVEVASTESVEVVEEIKTLE